MSTFRVEAEEHVQTLTAGFSTLEVALPLDQTHDLLESTFRSAHSLKGAARAVGLRPIESICHAMEGILRPLTNGELKLSPSMLAALAEGVRGVEHLLAGADPSLVDTVVVQLHAVAEPRDRSGIPGTGGDAGTLAASEQPALESAS